MYKWQSQGNFSKFDIASSFLSTIGSEIRKFLFHEFKTFLATLGVELTF